MVSAFDLVCPPGDVVSSATSIDMGCTRFRRVGAAPLWPAGAVMLVWKVEEEASSSSSGGVAGVEDTFILLLLLFVLLPPATAASNAAADVTEGEVSTVLAPPCSTSRSLVSADGMFIARSRGDKLACVAGLAGVVADILGKSNSAVCVCVRALCVKVCTVTRAVVLDP